MKTPARLNILILLLVCLMLVCVTRLGVYAAGALTGGDVSPAAATSNSMFEFYATYVDNPQNAIGKWPEYVTLSIDGVPVRTIQGSQLAAYLGIGNLVDGAKIVFRMSSGLDTMGNGFTPNTMFLQQSYGWKWVYPAGELLKSNNDGSAKSHRWKMIAMYQGDPVNGQTPDPQPLEASGTVTVYDSFYWSGIGRYGGKSGDSDELHNFPENFPLWDLNINPDPLKVDPYETQFPDEGTSTSTYTFETRYENPRGYPPLPWMTDGADPWNVAWGAPDYYEAGVMVYLRNLDVDPLQNHYWGNFHGHFMYREDLAVNNDANRHWILRVLPTGGIIGTNNNGWKTTWAWTSRTNHFYEALPPGRYEYYFATSDDNFSAFGLDDDKGSIWPRLDPDPATPTDPPVAPPATSTDRLYGAMGINTKTTNGYGYVDKRTYMPGGWTYGYLYNSWQGSSLNSGLDDYGNPVRYPAYTYPEVDPGLFQIATLEGGPRFLGTLTPYKFAVIPELPTGDPTAPYVGDTGEARLWSDTSGGTDKDFFTFRINYWQSSTATDSGDLPSYVRLYIKNSWDPDDTTMPWRSYDMNLSSSNSQPLNYKTGVMYEITLNVSALGYGPHCYYFQAADRSWVDARYAATTGVTLPVGSKVVRYPRRPDPMQYNGGIFGDGALPARLADDTASCIPLENDVINGPYINRRPELTENIVTPQIGSSGTEFVYRVKYTDPDNQRPYTPYLIIETDDQGNTATESMVRAPESSVPGNSTKRYDEGVVYEFRTSSAPGLIMQPGDRHYRFEFTDDWGRQTNQDIRVQGETVYLPQNGAGWLGGPRISGNTAPRLSQGTVRAADGSCNSATTWNYSVTYTDGNNNPPAYILAYIGRQDTTDGPIVWDSGHAMVETNATDIVYSDGKSYSFSTRLPGDNLHPVKYYSCFVASDGIDPADWDPVLSPSSGMVWKTARELTGVGGSTVLYDFGHKPILDTVAPSVPGMPMPTYNGPVLWGQLFGNNTQLIPGADYTLDPNDGQVTINSATAPITGKFWFGTEPDAQNGPIAVTGNHAPTLDTGQVIPEFGTSATLFTYSVTYKDLDGQAPQFVYVVIDDVPYAMVNIRSATTYKNGVEYQYTTLLPTGNHQFYFQTSDGADLVIFDADNTNTTVEPIPAPYVNDRPTLTGASVLPNGNVDQGQPITYSVTLTDLDNDQPLPDYPVVYIDNPSETDWAGSLSTAAIDNKVVDSTQQWTPGQFNGMPVVIITTENGSPNPIVFKIDHNTATELYLVATPDELLNVNQGDAYSIGKIAMQKQDPNDMIFSDGVVYEAKVPSLGIGTHKAHFKAVVHEQTQPGTFTDTTLRAPNTGDVIGPTVQAIAPPGNVAPVLANGGVTPHTGTASTPFRFAVTYSDANGDRPDQAHDGTTPYIRMQIEDTPGHWTIVPLTTDAQAPNFASGVEFSANMSGLALGPHNFFFEASDGWTTARFPSAGYQTVYVSRPPVLLQGEVTPISGNAGQVFEYRVKYKDPDGDAPAYIKLVIDGGAPIDMGVPIPGADYANGVVFSYPLLKGSLDVGVHNFYFIASDGNGFAWYDQDVRTQETNHDPLPGKYSTNDIPPSAVVPIDGPTVHTNTAPHLSAGGVLPGNGFDQDTYTYSVTYHDPDGDQPEYVECYIDDPDPLNPNAQRAYKMTKDPNTSDFVAGAIYRLVKTGLSAGTHTFYFKASDWLATAYYPADGSGNPQAPISGPVVATRGSATVNLNVPASVTIGSTATVTGTVLGYGGVPLEGVEVVLTITKPDSSTILPQPKLLTNSSGQFTYPEGSATWKPTVTGVWKVQATWAGSTQYLPSSSPEKSMSVTGPSYTVNGLDMISVPLQPLSSFADGALGSIPGFALAKWSATKIDYKMYSILPGVGRTDYDFPGIAPGQAYWIKTLVPKTIAPTGTLVDPNTDYSVALSVGWNQVGNPFTTDVQWSDLRVRRTINGVVQETTLAAAAANGWLREYGWTYDPSSGNYQLVDASRVGAQRTMRPWRGYWMKASMYCTLVIPGPTRRTSAAPAVTTSALAGSALAESSAAKWQVRLIAKNGDLKDEFNYLGESRAKEDLVESPACFQNYVDLYFTTKHGGMYASDLLSDVSVGSEWLFTVATDKAGEVELTWDGLESIPAGFQLVLVDEDGKSTEIVPGGSYKFTAGAGTTTKSFHIEVRKSGSNSSDTEKR